MKQFIRHFAGKRTVLPMETLEKLVSRDRERFELLVIRGDNAGKSLHHAAVLHTDVFLIL